MISIDIYTILSSKPHNPHYLKRYWKFIQLLQCQTQIKGVTEEHHICPKSKDLFPEYTNLKIHCWNAIHLTKRQHFVVHWLLSKSYGGKQIYAFWAMCNTQSPKGTRIREYKVSSKIYEKAKEEYTKIAKYEFSNKVVCWDIEGNRFTVSKEEYRNNCNLSSNMKGKIQIKNIITKETRSVSRTEYIDTFDKTIWLPKGCNGIFHTPFGNFTSYKDVNPKMCTDNERIICKNAVRGSKANKLVNMHLTTDMIGKTYKEVGFWYEKFE